MKILISILSLLISFNTLNGRVKLLPELNAVKPMSAVLNQVEVKDGIEYIHNTGTPLHPNKTVHFVEDLRIEGEKEDGDIVLFKPRLVFVDSRENIYIHEMQDQVIKVFDAEGKYVRTIGAKGSGPGEFQSVSSLGETREGQLIVTDGKARRTSFFDADGRFLRSFQWRVRYGVVYLTKNSSYLTTEPALAGIMRFNFVFMKEIDFEGKEIRSYGEFPSGEAIIIDAGGRRHYMSHPDPPMSIFTADPEKEWLYRCMNNKYIIEVYDTSGKVFRKIDRPYKPVAFTEQDAGEYRVQYTNDPYGVITKALKEMKMPEIKTIATRMMVDSQGCLWIQTNEKRKERERTETAFDIFDTDGRYYARTWSAVIPHIFKKGKMYRMDEDRETGYQTLKRLKVTWK